MSVRFAPGGWQKWLEQYVRMAKTVHLATGPCDKPDELTELSGGGYFPHELIGANWERRVVSEMATETYPELLWVFTGPIPTKVTGYFVRDSDGEVLWWEPFAEPPFEVKRAGDRTSVEMIVAMDTIGG